MSSKYEISTRLIDRVALSRDASLYALTPLAVARPRTVDDVQHLLQWCRDHNTHVTFRAAGTSLSGQAVTRGVLADLSRHWREIEVMNNGALLRVQPGVTGGTANAVLRPYGRKIGPDPASIMSAMIGGIVANNASGMCCGTAENSYHTIHAVKGLLADGTRFDTAVADADERFRAHAPHTHAALLRIRDEVRADNELVALIRRKYRIKNTIGYSINAFLDEDEPVRILARLMIGSEGTLGFIEDVVFRTVADAPYKFTGVVMFTSIEAAAEAVAPLRERGAAAVELMDTASLRSVRHLPWVPAFLHVDDADAEHTALLVEFHAASSEDLQPLVSSIESTVALWHGTVRQQWSTDPNVQASYWRVRKGLMPTVGAARPAGTTMINEDVAVPPHLLAQLVRDLRACFDRHQYSDAIIFGHAKDGNLHFVVNQDFSTQDEVDRYARFMEDLAGIVADTHGGSLKAEHGTGRNMAPFVEREWGSAAYRIMRQVKRVLDPENLLNPGVVLNDDHTVHLRDIKAVPAIDPVIDRCIECGFCERVCPTRDVTLTPRQRITLRRDIALRSRSEQEELVHDYQYAGTDTCVTDGMCGMVCPVGIDTGAMVKDLRQERSSGVVRALASVAASNFSLVNTIARTASRAFSLRGVVPNPSSLPTSSAPHDRSVVYMPACPSRWSGSDSAENGLPNAILALAQRAGVHVHIPTQSSSMCCGQIFDSKGLHEAAERVRSHTVNALRHEGNTTRVMIDASTCACAMREHAGGEHVIDIMQWIEEDILPHLTMTARKKRVILHPGCGIAKLGSTERMVRIAQQCAEEVVIPQHAHCCGMGGDRGIRYPEITRAATAQEATEVQAVQADGWYSANPICEHRLTSATGRPYRSIVQLVLDASAH